MGQPVIYGIVGATNVGGSSGLASITDASACNTSMTTTSTTVAYLAKADANYGFRGVAFTPTQFVLLVSVASFSGSLINGSSHLKWITTSEINAKEFVVERSANGSNYTSIGVVAATNRNHETTYGFEEAITQANKSEANILCLGEKNTWSGEHASRSSIALPAIQEKLLAQLKKTGKPIILILTNGRPLELVRMEPMADAMVELWQPGVAGGTPLAGALSGRINPSGKLPITFPLTTGHIPTYYNMRQSARPFDKMGNYQDINTEPLYWFGHGLSYTSFEYDPAKLSATQIKKSQQLTVEIKVKNTGTMAGKEAVLWFIADPVSTVSRPMKELKYFEKKEIKAGETVSYQFTINPQKDMSYTDAAGNKLLETGDFFVLVGNQKIKFQLIN